jgi:tetratricopeptide (TPR) repeat protein
LNQRLIADKIFAIRGAYSQFLERHPDHIKAKMAFASFLYDEGETETAIKHWRQVLQRDPKNAAAHNNLANHFGHAGEWKLALTEYESALAILPTESLYHFNYASVMDLYRKEIAPARGWSEMEMTRRIVSELKIARDLSPTEFPYAKTYASSLDNGVPPDWKEALAAWKFCLQLSGKPEETDFVNANAARVCLELGDKSQAHAFIAAMVLPFSLPMKQDLEKRLQKLP